MKICSLEIYTSRSGKKPTKSCFLFLPMLACFFILPGYAAAESRFIAGFETQKLSALIRDDFRNRIYIADSANSRLVIINTTTEATESHSLLSTPLDLALSKDGSRLAVADGSSIVSIYDAETMQRYGQVSIGLRTHSVAFDSRGRLLSATLDDGQYSTRGPLRLIDLNSSQFIGDTGKFRRALIKTDAQGNSVYIGERGVSPLSLHRYDIGDTELEYVADDIHGSLGSNLKDFRISPDNSLVFLASGSPYAIQVLDAETMVTIRRIETDPYPNGVALGPKGRHVYTSSISSYNYNLYSAVVDDESAVATPLLPMPDVSNEYAADRGIEVSGDGSKVFIATGTSYSESDLWLIQVHDTGVSDSCELPDADSDGIVDVANLCPDTPNGNNVDETGCSQDQFCARHVNFYACYFADFLNDEPYPGSFVADDCGYVWNASKGTITCISK